MASAPTAVPPLPLESHKTLTQTLMDTTHYLGLASGSSKLSQSALDTSKRTFDAALALEIPAWPTVRGIIAQLSDSAAGPSTRKRQTKISTETPEDKARRAAETLPFTSLTELYTDDMDDHQIWEQLEMRNKIAVGLLKAVGISIENPNSKEDDAEEDAAAEEEEDEDSEEDVPNEAEERFLAFLQERRPDLYKRVMAGGELTEKDWEDMAPDMEEFGEMMADDDDEDEDDDDLDDGSEGDEHEDDISDLEDDENMEGLDMEGSDEELEDADDSDMDEDVSLEDGVEGSSNEDDDQEEAVPVRTSFHPELDDQFFSIDEFNRQTEEAEAAYISSGKLGGEDDDEDDDEGGDLAALLSGSLDDSADIGNPGDIMYSDFFAPPPKMPAKRKQDNSKGSAKTRGSSKTSNGAALDDVAAEANAEPRSTMDRVKTDLFADDDAAQEERSGANLSSHEKRMLALQEQIASLEAENVGDKEWTLLGEATARARPENSLLEENLDFEHMGKVVPMVTEEKVQSLEEIIKKRILDNNFDDIVRRREVDDKAFLPSRYFELQDSQSSKSLAQIYEDEYSAAASGSKVLDPRDAKLAKDHEEIDKLWDDISYKLDALSNLNFTPKQPKANITTVSNIATTSIESAMPATQSTATMLAPEEMFAPPSASELVSRTELTPEEKRRARQKARKEKMHQRQALDKAVDKFAGKTGAGGGKARGGVRAEKDRALAELVKTGKGVTVVGKDSVGKKKGSRPAASSDVQTSALKL